MSYAINLSLIYSSRGGARTQPKILKQFQNSPEKLFKYFIKEIFSCLGNILHPKWYVILKA